VNERKPVWPWLVAALVSLVLGFATVLVVWFWYMDGVFAVDIEVSGDQLVASVAPFHWNSLTQLVIPATIATAVCTLVGLGLYQAFGRRAGPALFAAAGGPAIAFVFQVISAAYVRAVEVLPGEKYFGDHIVVLAGYAMMLLVPAVVSASAVVIAARDEPGLPIADLTASA